MIRRLFMVAAVLSLLLCMASAFLWVRSYGHMDQISLEAVGTRGECFASKTYFITSCRGVIDTGTSEYVACDHDNPGDDPFVVERRSVSTNTSDAGHVIDTDAPSERWRFRRYWKRMGFGSWQAIHSDEDSHAVTAPHWFFAMLTLLIPVRAAVRASIAASRLRRRHCPQCGYDLRASTDQCPECGTPIVTSTR